jgi:thymidine kinase
MLGSLTFFTGPMACGKTLELIRHLQIYAEQQIPTVCIRPALDTRSSVVESRAGLRYDGITLSENDLSGIQQILHRYDVIGIDEVQFFIPDITPLLQQALREGKTILIAGLDTDFRGAMFPTSLALISLPETIIQRTRAVCRVCRKHTATRTQRLDNGEPARSDAPVIAVEGAAASITYEPRCLEHHVFEMSS